MYIRRTVQRISSANGNRKTKVIVSTPKSETSFRSVVIPDFLIEYFRMFKSQNDFFILSGSDKVVEPRTMQYRYKKILEFARTNHNFHKLRHAFATNCTEKGFDVKTLSVILGHSSANLTLNRYIHLDRSHERKLMNSSICVFSCKLLSNQHLENKIYTNLRRFERFS